MAINKRLRNGKNDMTKIKRDIVTPAAHKAIRAEEGSGLSVTLKRMVPQPIKIPSDIVIVKIRKIILVSFAYRNWWYCAWHGETALRLFILKIIPC